MHLKLENYEKLGEKVIAGGWTEHCSNETFND